MCNVSPLSRQSSKWHGIQDPSQLGFTNPSSLNLHQALFAPSYWTVHYSTYCIFTLKGHCLNGLPYYNQNPIFPLRPISNASWNFCYWCSYGILIMLQLWHINRLIVYLPIRLVSVLFGNRDGIWLLFLVSYK